MASIIQQPAVTIRIQNSTIPLPGRGNVITTLPTDFIMYMGNPEAYMGNPEGAMGAT